MQKPKKEHPKEKNRLHIRNKHRERYDFKLLIESCPELAPFVINNIYNDESIDFFNPEAVKILNKALLKCYYDIENWDIPENYLCPPIPGRADYIHHIAELIGNNNYGKIPTGKNIRCLDIGVGANCVYPIIGVKEYNWSFVGVDIDSKAINSANQIIENNPILKDNVEIRFQKNAKDIFNGIIQNNEIFDLTICNPPFHSSAEEAQLASISKVNNLTNNKIAKPVLNFGGTNNELWCEGGESRFLKDMISQSRRFAQSCFWFSSLISKQSNLKNAYDALKITQAVDVKTIPMGQGNKSSRLVAWTFLSYDEQKKWKHERWK